ncbi:PREDICTED: LOW QUALITY PROTEIN: uncharacterized protein LOC102107254 [Pseudopodoces humilis]|uniref:LOW QUALITY PROTEIN: uncharacterized protein LOC102107254 n=1 Tax=Pseudopodoces humilis TaxID=181119 RepID=UPI0006B74F6D|nr:PREDICTED: LOW QUALITY PROTEIN: uncharacterized protein LOC102107254 [Pseudopodoces humilis]
MEMSTVSLSPTSPTEGDNLCETDVTNVASCDTNLDSVTLLICTCGLAGNRAVISLLNIGFTTDFIFNLAVAIFLFLLLMLPSTLLLLVDDVSCSATSSSGALKNHFLCRKQKNKQKPNKKVPQPNQWNVGLYHVVFMNMIRLLPSLCQFHEQHCQGTCFSEKGKPKKLHIVIFISLHIILPLSLWNILQQLSYTILPSQADFLLARINPFIYFLVETCWKNCSMGLLRESLQRVFGEPEENAARNNEATRDTAV